MTEIKDSPELKRLINMLLRYKSRDNGADRATLYARILTSKLQPSDPRPGWVDALANAHRGYEVEACQEALADLKTWLEERDLSRKNGGA